MARHADDRRGAITVSLKHPPGPHFVSQPARLPTTAIPPFRVTPLLDSRAVNEKPTIRGAAVLAAAALLNACGASSDNTENGNASKRTRQSLQQPIYPRCLPQGFARQQVRELATGSKDIRAWALTYGRKTTPSNPQPNPTTNFLIVESPPSTPGPAKKDFPRQKTINGHRVGYRALGSKAQQTIAAEWKTDRAQYSLLANGTTHTTITRIISCLP